MAESKLYTKMVWDMVYYLVDQAIEIINEARRTKNTEIITGTQWDSYGAAVFFNGKLYYSIKSSDPAKDLSRSSRYIETIYDEQKGRHKGYKSIPAGYGREWAKMFIQEIKSSAKIPKKGFCLIVFNAAFYSKVQENTGKYQIISQLMSSGPMVRLKNKYSHIGATLKPL